VLSATSDICNLCLFHIPCIDKASAFAHATQGRGSSSSLHGEGRELRGFKLFLRAYIYAPEQATFVPVPDMPRHLPRQIRKALHDLHQIDTAGISSSDLTALCVMNNNE